MMVSSTSSRYDLANTTSASAHVNPGRPSYSKYSDASSSSSHSAPPVVASSASRGSDAAASTWMVSMAASSARRERRCGESSGRSLCSLTYGICPCTAWMPCSTPGRYSSPRTGSVITAPAYTKLPYRYTSMRVSVPSSSGRDSQYTCSMAARGVGLGGREGQGGDE